MLFIFCSHFFCSFFVDNICLIRALTKFGFVHIFRFRFIRIFYRFYIHKPPSLLLRLAP